ncbi:hypothetical protein [Paenibacillus ehimensis]|uniref:Uncharacterized protein n=1 Tax=Paenibacillus ehimensis TaxID=79264 RepID=A0ABT8V3N4_9BACL|nr:hypothetical protein [Paenibacillus ehimensis]MDO3676033.1 hypothetical protein [Paenibacillus ehimensis]MEC0213343.1 hypothetical protein [Paenibacillus ehimensis]
MKKVWLSLVLGLFLVSGVSGIAQQQQEPDLLSTYVHNGTGG